MKIYKLNYTDKETAIADLLNKNIYIKQIFEDEESLSYGEGVQAIVEIGKICLNQPTEDIPPIFASGYHYDIMCIQDIDFGSNEIIVNNPKHSFLGYDNNY
tara:strand:+ start:489 stop:791 length:303 start_codon:yes stop_codon:yes gene_type:complete